MKTYYKLMICFFIIGQHSIAQSPVNIYTPKGSLVTDTYIFPEALTAYDIQYINGRLTLEYPNAIKLQEATSTYNCHAYAWHMVEGGNPVWMGWNLNPTSIYWTDGSYVEVNSAQGTKVSYASDNHSAITTSDNNVFISKWGTWPLVKHRKDDCPYNFSNLKYYKRATSLPSISGPSVVCDEATYTIENLPAGATVQWSASDNILPQSGQGASTAVFSGSGQGYVHAKIIMQGNVVIELNKDVIFYEGVPSAPNISYNYSTSLYPNTTYTIQCSSNEADTYTWTIIGDAYFLKDGVQSSYITSPDEYVSFTTGPGSPGMGEILRIRCVARNGCGASGASTVEFEFMPRGSAFTLSPNPATDLVTVRMEEESPRNSTTPPSGVTEIQLWSAAALLRTYKTDQRTYQISVSDLPKGIYFVRVIKDGKTHTRKLLKK